MARPQHKLSDVKVKATGKPGRHSDGGGLYLNVSVTGSKSWLFMWTPKGSARRREMGLGGYPAVSLAGARAKAAENRSLVATGINPIAERDKTPDKTFGEAADELINSMKPQWRNAKHAWQWEQTLTAGCAAIRNKRVSEISVEDVLTVLNPIWQTKSETASRLRGRVERVLNYAKVKGWRVGENPAAWRGNLADMLPKRKRLARGHHSAMPYADVPVFMARLRDTSGLAARALEFTILSVARSGETLGARWPELDAERTIWTVPAERMKAGEAHQVPLVLRATHILAELQETSTGPYVFPSGTGRRDHLSNMAMLMLLRRMGYDALTVHGFRSAFRDWCGDQTTFAREVAEAALAHKVGNAVEQAYRRGSALEKRRKLMEAWARYCAGGSKNNVVPIGDAKRTA